VPQQLGRLKMQLAYESLALQPHPFDQPADRAERQLLLGFGVDVGVVLLDLPVRLACHVPAPVGVHVVAQHGSLGDTDLRGDELDALPRLRRVRGLAAWRPDASSASGTRTTSAGSKLDRSPGSWPAPISWRRCSPPCASRQQGHHPIESAVELFITVVHYDETATAGPLFQHSEHQVPSGPVEVGERFVDEVDVRVLT
jgi:hypothetical protein